MAEKAILFLYEGESEGEFYPLVFRTKITPRGIKFSKNCLKGNYNINAKVANAIDSFLTKNGDVDLYVFVALDRDKPRPSPPPINVKVIIDTVDSNRIKEINLIVATHDFESWLFLDIDNIYRYLRAPRSRRVPQKFQNYESLCHHDMTKLFRQFGQEYRKGRRVAGLIEQLDIERIYNYCADLRQGIAAIAMLCDVK